MSSNYIYTQANSIDFQFNDAKWTGNSNLTTQAKCMPQRSREEFKERYKTKLEQNLSKSLSLLLLRNYKCCTNVCVVCLLTPRDAIDGLIFFGRCD